MFYQQGSTEMEGHEDGIQTLYLMNPNNYISYTESSSQFMGNNIPQSHHQHDPSRPSEGDHRNFQQHNGLWGLAADQQQQQQQTPKGLSLSLGDDDPSLFQGRFHVHHHDDHDDDVKNVIMGSKYLKAAQELLDEVVSVVVVVDKQAKPPKINNIINSNNNNNCGTQLTSAQRQEFLIKKTKLNSMLDEVEQRHKQYHQQMQMMVTSFQQVAGNGSAKTYTQLALKTILKQFRCLKNTISSQIKALCKTLGEEDDDDDKNPASRLRFVDHDHLRQQCTLQQLGMMQSSNSAWRPQRGLPERAVSVLRAWLFEHFLHPYPKDSDKHTLAKQTGLTRSQVSNWFINARVRLWKPMVEDMYLEEIKNQETVPDDSTTKHGPSNPRQANNKPPPSEISASTIITKSPTRDNIEKNPTNNNPKKPRNDSSPRSMLSVEMENDRTIISKSFNDNMENYLTSSSSGFSNGYGISSGFQGNNINSNNFSLTLALPPSGNYSQQQNFLSHGNFEFGTRIEPVVESNDAINNPNNGHYEILDFQNRKPFSSRVIPDHHFVT